MIWSSAHTYCGGELTEKEVKHTCPACGYEVEGDFAFCPKCGTGLGSGSKVAPEKKVEVENKKEIKNTLEDNEFVVALYTGNSFFNKGSGFLTVGDDAITFEMKIKTNILVSLPLGIYAAKKENLLVLDYSAIVSIEQKGMSLSKFNSVDLVFNDGKKISFAFQLKKNATKCAELIRMHMNQR